MEKLQQNPGRPVTRVPKFPEHKDRAEILVKYLEDTGIIKTRKELADLLGINAKTLTNWTTGQTETSNQLKYSFVYLFGIKMEYWEAEPGANPGKYLRDPLLASPIPPVIVQWNPLLDPFSSQVSHNKYSLEAQQTARYWRAVIFQATEPEQQRKFARWKRLLFDMVDAAMEHLEEPILVEEARIISRNQSNEAVARMLDNLRKRDQRKISHPVNAPEEIAKGTSA